MELVGPSKRTPCGVAFQAAFAGGIMLVAGWATLIKDRQILQVVYGLHGLLLFAHWWLMDESPRWLWNQGRQKEAVDIVAKGVKTNRRGVGLDKEHYLSRSKPQRVSIEEPKSPAGISDLFKTPNLRMKTLNVCLCWFANSIAYYGLSLSSVSVIFHVKNSVHHYFKLFSSWKFQLQKRFRFWDLKERSFFLISLKEIILFSKEENFEWKWILILIFLTLISNTFLEKIKAIFYYSLTTKVIGYTYGDFY